MREAGTGASGANRRSRSLRHRGIEPAEDPMRLLNSCGEEFHRFMEAVKERGRSVEQEVEDRVRLILGEIREHGEEALMRWAREIDGMPVGTRTLEVLAPEWDAAFREVSTEDLAALELAAERIRAFHARQVEGSWLTVDARGARLGQLIRPLDRVGVYVPGGKASYPSSVLMTVIPAKVAGVAEVIVCSPLSWTGPNPMVLAAARLAGADRVFRLGGVQAIAAMAFGVGDVPKVDKVVGPGNAYVATAKRMVSGGVGTDMVAGPSEILIVADGSVPAAWAAADILSQAEHDEMASAMLLTPSRSYAFEVEREVSRQLARSERASIARASLARFGAVIVTRDLDEAFDIASVIAPEHLELLVERPMEHLGKVRHAGAVFLGAWSPEAVGDYVAGPSHVLPTGGTARFSSPLGVWDFLKRTSVIGLSQGPLEELGPSASRLASMEGLGEHARSIEVRLAERRR